LCAKPVLPFDRECGLKMFAFRSYPNPLELGENES
jgi:hypothetical protein